MNKQKNPTANTRMTSGLIGLVVLLAILVFGNLIIGRTRLRVDLTKENIYTLTDGTRNIVRHLEEPVTLKLYFSKSAEVPTYIKEHARRVSDLLEEYRLASKGNITVEHYDPKPDSDEEEWAKRYGVNGRPVTPFGPPVYFGLVATTGDTEGTVPGIDPRREQLLEYDITRLVYRVGNPSKPVIGVMSSLPVLGSGPANPMMMMQGQQPQPAWIVFQQIQSDLDVRRIEPTAESIPADLDTLMVVHPKELSDATLYAIDQFLLRGGRLMVFVDPLSVADLMSSQGNPMMMQMNQGSSDLKKLFDAWGIGYDAAKVLADKRAASLISGVDGRPEESPVVLSLTADNVSKDDVLTSQLETLTMYQSGAFIDRTGDDLTVTPLITSSDSSCLVNSTSARFGGQALRSEVKATGQNYNLAARIDGKFKTAFPEGAPAVEETENEGQETESTDGLKEGESSVLLVGDVDMLFDQVCVEVMNFLGSRVYQPRNDNLNFFANASELMAGSSDLIGIRSRGTFARPFTKVDEIEDKAREEQGEHEQQLMQKLQQAQRKLDQLQSEKDESQRLILTPEQQAARKAAQEDIREFNRQLKEVRKNMRRDIESLGAWVKFYNIALMPLLIALGGVGYGVYRRKK